MLAPRTILSLYLDPSEFSISFWTNYSFLKIINELSKSVSFWPTHKRSFHRNRFYFLANRVRQSQMFFDCNSAKFFKTWESLEETSWVTSKTRSLHCFHETPCPFLQIRLNEGPSYEQGCTANHSSENGYPLIAVTIYYHFKKRWRRNVSKLLWRAGQQKNWGSFRNSGHIQFKLKRF